MTAPVSTTARRKRVRTGLYQYGEWRIERIERMSITLWAVYVDGTLTANLWNDPAVRSFATLTDATMFVASQKENP